VSQGLLELDWGALGDRLLEWYARQGRDLPWRRSREPYGIWISEVMLQQTQVGTVLPYFERWLEQFPNVETLAQADQQTVLKAWEGLGYYSRARNLHRAAMVVTQEFGGVFPQTFDQVIKLPGIGRTTAGGILSAAFNQPLPILDGNVKRVIARIVALEVPTSQAIDRLWTISEQLVPKAQGRDFNQAFMDLGATVCTPKNPDCPSCPWQGDCKAKHLGLQGEIPRVVKRGPLPQKWVAVVMVVNRQGEWLIVQRPQKGLLAGLWDFPQVEFELEAPDLGAMVRRDYGVEVGDIVPLMEVNHAYTHFKVTFVVYRAACLGRAVNLPLEQPHAWVLPQDLGQYPFPKSHLKMIKAVM
jgi:A/G-specific adenine glycosylase